MLQRLKKLYWRIGMHTAPSGTLLHAVNRGLIDLYEVAARSRVKLSASNTMAEYDAANFNNEPDYCNDLPSKYPDEWYWLTTDGKLNRLSPDLESTKQEDIFRHNFMLNGQDHVLFSIDNALRRENVKGIALAFFMGNGDYIFATPFIRTLRLKYPNARIIGYVSETLDHNNSPLVAKLMEVNPDIDEVRSYKGVVDYFFKNYDYSDIKNTIEPGYVIIPVLYEHMPDVRHRVNSLYKTFLLKRPSVIPAPIIHLPAVTPPHVLDLASRIKSAYQDGNKKGAVFLQLDARSTGFQYPQADELARRLIEKGFVVFSVSEVTFQSPYLFPIDLKQFSIIDSIALLKKVHEEIKPTYILSVASVFSSISAGLGIPHLSMQHFDDDKVHTVWYPNIYVISHVDYQRIPVSRMFYAEKSCYKLYQNNHAVLAIFHPEFVMSCFDVFDMRNRGITEPAPAS